MIWARRAGVMGVPMKWEIARIFVVGTGGSGFCAKAAPSGVIGFFMAVAPYPVFLSQLRSGRPERLASHRPGRAEHLRATGARLGRDRHDRAHHGSAGPEPGAMDPRSRDGVSLVIPQRLRAPERFRDQPPDSTNLGNVIHCSRSSRPMKLAGPVNGSGGTISSAWPRP